MSFVYVLIDGIAGEPFYFGISTDYRRVLSHLGKSPNYKYTSNNNPHVLWRCLTLEKRGTPAYVDIVEDLLTRREAQDRERFYINSYGITNPTASIKKGPLMNKINGGGGRIPKDEEVEYWTANIRSQIDFNDVELKRVWEQPEVRKLMNDYKAAIDTSACPEAELFVLVIGLCQELGINKSIRVRNIMRSIAKQMGRGGEYNAFIEQYKQKDLKATIEQCLSGGEE